MVLLYLFNPIKPPVDVVYNVDILMDFAEISTFNVEKIIKIGAWRDSRINFCRDLCLSWYTVQCYGNDAKQYKYGCRCKASIVKRRGQVIYELVREPDV